MSRITIVSGIQLSTNPRVVKEADTLSAAGNEVEVIGATLEKRLGDRDRALFRGKPWSYTVLFDAASSALSDRLELLGARARLRFWRDVHARLGIANPRQLGIAGPEMLKYCLAHPAELYIVHNPQGVWVGVELMRRGRRVSVDIEDWYSENLVPGDRREFPAEDLRRLEGAVLRGAAYSTTTSHRLSEALVRSYDCPPPAVVYNSFPWAERNAMDGKTFERKDASIPSLCWFSQVIGPLRGLETLVDALRDVRIPFEIHLRGNCRDDYRELLLARAPEAWRTRIHFHSQVPHAELLSRIAEHDIGLAVETTYCLNRQLTVTNKILTYLLAGVAVLASDTEGQKEIAAMSDGAVTTFAADSSSDLASALNRTLSDPAQLRAARGKALAVAERHFCWERSAPVFLEQVERALGKRPQTVPAFP